MCVHAHIHCCVFCLICHLVVRLHTLPLKLRDCESSGIRRGESGERNQQAKSICFAGMLKCVAQGCSSFCDPISVAIPCTELIMAMAYVQVLRSLSCIVTFANARIY